MTLPMVLVTIPVASVEISKPTAQSNVLNVKGEVLAEQPHGLASAQALNSLPTLHSFYVVATR